MIDRYNCTTGGMDIAEWPGGDYVDASDYDALAVELAKWRRKHQVEVGWACAKVEESADRINALEAGLRLVVSLTTPCECVPCTRIRTEALNVLEPNAGLTVSERVSKDEHG